MVAGNYSLHYSGPEWSFLAINGKSNYDRLFSAGIDVFTEPLDGSVKHSVLIFSLLLYFILFNFIILLILLIFFF